MITCRSPSHPPSLWRLLVTAGMLGAALTMFPGTPGRQNFLFAAKTCSTVCENWLGSTVHGTAGQEDTHTWGQRAC